MTGITNDWPRSGLRKAMWLGAAALLLAPAVAMRFDTGVDWDAADFIFAGVLLALAGAGVEIGMRASAGHWHRAGVVVAVGGAFATVWVNAAVGMIGSEDNPANLLYLGVIAVALLGSVLARLRPRGMAAAMVATLVAHLMVGLAALVAGWGGDATPTREIVGVTAVFALPWLLAAALFNAAARRGGRP